jgi:hypothetical protein
MEQSTYRLTIEKMRNLIMQTEMCRKDKNCGACRRVNFCAIWNNRWPDIAIERINGNNLEAYSEYKVKDIPALVSDRILDAVSKTCYALMLYMHEKDLFFNADYTGFVSRTKDSNDSEGNDKKSIPQPKKNGEDNK